MKKFTIRFNDGTSAIFYGSSYQIIADVLEIWQPDAVHLVPVASFQHVTMEKHKVCQ